MSFPLKEMIDEPPPAPEGESPSNENIVIPPIMMSHRVSVNPYLRHAAEMITLEDAEEDMMFEERRRTSLIHTHHRPAHRVQASAVGGQGSRSGGDSFLDELMQSGGAILHHAAPQQAAPGRVGVGIAATRKLSGLTTSTAAHLASVHEARSNSFAHVSAASGAAPPGSPRTFGDSFTDDGTAGAVASSIVAPGIGPQVLKKLAEAYELACKDLGPAGELIANLCGTSVLTSAPSANGFAATTNDGSRSPSSCSTGGVETPHVVSAAHKQSSFATPLNSSPHHSHQGAMNNNGSSSSEAVHTIMQALLAQPPDLLAHHCVELHLILLRLLEVARQPHHLALVAMQSMASLSPQQIVPFQTTYTMEKVVDDDGMKSINGYLVLEELGRGSCAKVKLAFDAKNSRMVAIKIVRRVDMTVRVGGQTQAQQQYQSLQREIAVMKKLRHKNIVSLYEIIDDPDAEKLYIVMQYVDNGPITTMKGDHCAIIEPILLLRYARHIFAGLMYLHHHKVVHRDIKLENILVSKERVAYLADFGVSDVFGLATSRERRHRKDRKEAQTIEGHKGTVLYMAPELLADGQAENGMAVDMWACGVTLYAALTGELPFKSADDILNARARLKLPHRFGKEWEHLIGRLLSVRPEERPTAVKAHSEAQRMLSNAEKKLAAENAVKNAADMGSKKSSLEIQEGDLDMAFTPVFTAVQKDNSMLQEGRFNRAQLMGVGYYPFALKNDRPPSRRTLKPNACCRMQKRNLPLKMQ
ncbi:protein kinase, putative [Bodo saltans]|uniref:non-specific serine/threonine protein kinase n=1 Tax=Bodo saltans TaxID=75058 RepID=A0A0S4KHC4_BODSA|nr:protein kinase, putative [Bodo saltans]|eukprot:CUI14512.1 protein kinase, putative [Bodo saltans]